MKRVLIVSDPHGCQFQRCGMDRRERLDILKKQINDEYEKEPYEYILFLGDYSLDHWQWNVKGSWLVEGKSYTKDFVEEYCGDLPAPYYLLPGNHEQYGEELWREITGCSREAEIVVGDIIFVLWDSYGADLDPDFHSDGTYTPPKVERIRNIMAADPDKRVILCSHYFAPCGSDEEKALISDPRVLCLIQGHTHSSRVLTLPEEYGSKLVLQAGSWAGINPSKEAWGVRDINICEDKIVSRYIVPDLTLCHEGTTYEIPAHYRDGAEIKK